MAEALRNVATPAEMLCQNEINHLKRQTSISASIEAKRVFGAVANLLNAPGANLEKETAAPGRRGGDSRDGAGKLKSRTRKKYRSALQSASPDYREPVITVCDGRTTTANIYATADCFDAVLADGRTLGTFATVKDARAAISEARRAAA